MTVVQRDAVHAVPTAPQAWWGTAAAVVLAHAAALAGLLWAQGPRTTVPDRVVPPVQLLVVSVASASTVSPPTVPKPPAVPKPPTAQPKTPKASPAPKPMQPQPTPPVATAPAEQAVAVAPAAESSAQAASAAPAPAASSAEKATQAPASAVLAAAVPDIVAPSSRAAYLRNPAPEYPLDSRRLGEQGVVVLRVLIDAEGRPQQVDVKRSSGHARLDRTAREAVLRWRFVAGMRNGVAEAMWHDVPLKFSLG